MIKRLFSTVFYWFMWVVIKNTHVIAEFCEWIRKRSIRLVWRVSFHTQRSQRLGSVALVCIRREWPSSHSLTFPNALHVLIMIRGKGQRIPACLAAAAHRLLAMYSGRRALVTGVCQPEENRPWFTAVFACEDNKRGLCVNTSDLFSVWPQVDSCSTSTDRNNNIHAFYVTKTTQGQKHETSDQTVTFYLCHENQTRMQFKGKVPSKVKTWVILYSKPVLSVKHYI